MAPGSPDLGVMLPYTALHHLLVAGAGGDLVMTSGNVSDEPIAFEDADARERLASIADLFLTHDRPIETRVDDSVMRVAGGRRLTVRRSRGFVPDSIGLPVPAARPLLACGAELKSTFCLARGPRAWVGPHIGDLKNYETLQSFSGGVAHLERLFAVAPEVVAHDLHPDYLSTRYALEREGVRHFGVQHHHAHLAACLAEHGERGPAVGAIFDGSGYGSDGTVWGGEVLVGGLDGFTRAGHLRPVRLPGGDRAVRQPWRMACAWLEAVSGGGSEVPTALAGDVEPERWNAVASMCHSGLSAPETTSAGRLFDAVAALCGVRAEVTYEGQAAIELEAACDLSETGAYPMPIDGVLVLDARETVAAAARDAAAGVPVPLIATRFHRALAGATAEACAAAAEGAGLATVVLSGGVFQNRVLLELTCAEVERRGLRVLVPERLPRTMAGSPSARPPWRRRGSSGGEAGLMFGLDDAMAGLGGDGGVVVALAVALLLGLRHATDPDHLTAVSTLVMSEDERGARRAAGLGVAWGLGHAVTLFALGLPVVLLGSTLPDWLQRGFELAVGAVIVLLAARLLLRWRRGYFHVHEHTHGDVRHAHPHVHERAPAAPHPHSHEHSHAPQLGRSPVAAFGIGLIHGAGGSAGVAVLLVAAVPGAAAATAALTVLAAGTAISMTAVTALFGHALAAGPLPRRFELAAPVLGGFSLLFGLWYGLAALDAVPYVL